MEHFFVAISSNLVSQSQLRPDQLYGGQLGTSQSQARENAVQGVIDAAGSADGHNDIVAASRDGARVTTSTAATPAVGVPPAAAETIISFLCLETERETLLGDLAEGFRGVTRASDRRAAQWWYWWQVSRSAVAFGLRLVTALVAFGELFRRLGL